MFIENEKYLAVSCGDNENIIHVWDKEYVNDLNLPGHENGTVSISEFDKYVISIGLFEIKVWELPYTDPVNQIDTS